MTTNDQMRALCEAARKSVANMYEAVYSVSDHVGNDALKDADDAKETLAEFFSTALTQLSEQAARVKVLEDALRIAIDFRKNPQGVSFEAVKKFIEETEKLLSNEALKGTWK